MGVIGGPSVNSGVQQAEQGNQKMAEKYAAQQQAQALAALQSYMKSNPSPASGTNWQGGAGGANTVGGSGVITPPGQTLSAPTQPVATASAQQPATGAAGPSQAPQIPPQMRAQILAMMQQQRKPTG